MIAGSDKVNDIQTFPFSPSTLIIYYNQNLPSLPLQILTSQVLKPIKIQVPMPFPYKKNNEVSWNYTYQVLSNSIHDPTMTMLNHGSASSITNICRINGITCNGCCYSLKELEKQQVEELER